jgi:hypothetical protein
MGQCMEKCSTMTRCMFTKNTNNLQGPNELGHGHVMVDRHTSAEWYLFGGCNVLVVTTFRTGLLLFPLLFIAITMTR